MTVAADSARLTKRDWLGLSLAVGLAFLIHGWIAWHDYHTSSFTDSIDYLFMADFYRASFYGGDIGDWLRRYYQYTRFPPLFPMLLGALGAGSDHQHLAGAVSNGLAVAAVASVWAWVRVDTKRLALATMVAIALILYPYHFVLNLSPVSEPLGMLLTFSAFALLTQRGATEKRVAIAACLVGLAPLARTALVPLVVAFLIWLIPSRWLSRQTRWVAALLATLPYGVWFLYRGTMQADQYEGYLTAEQYANANIAWPEALWVQPMRLFDAFRDSWIPEPTLPVTLASAAILLLAGIGSLVRLREGKLDAWFLGGYLMLILLWPFPTEFRRLLVAVYPCLLVCAISAVRFIASPRVRRPACGLLLTSLLLAHGLGSIHLLRLATLPVDAELLGEKREPAFFLQPNEDSARAVSEGFARGRLLLSEASRLIPPNACVYASPPLFARLYASRSSYNYPQDLGDDVEAARSRLTRCDYFLVGAWGAGVYGLPPWYPSAALEGWTEPLLMSNYSADLGGGTAAVLLRRRLTPPEAELKVSE